MFTVAEREGLRATLIAHGREDPRVTACALLGSAARDAEDPWSDIDLALRLTPDADVEGVAREWTQWLGEVTRVADTMDITAFGALYRVFLLDTSLQVDLSFWPHDQFRATGEPFRLVFGDANAPGPSMAPRPHGLVRMGWLYALHARSAVARDRRWQAEMMLAEVRHQILALACLRLGLDPRHGREAHRLPPELVDELVAARAARLEPEELTRSFSSTVEAFHTEVGRHDPQLARSLAAPLRAMVLPPSPGSRGVGNTT